MVLLRLLAFKPQGTQPLAEKKTLNNATAPLAPTAGRPAPSAPVAAPAQTPAARPVVAAVQPWDEDLSDSTSSPPAVAALPAGQHLQVRDPGAPAVRSTATGGGLDVDIAQNNGKNSPLALVEPAQAATKVIAIPVHTSTESRADQPAQTAMPVLTPTPEGDFWFDTVQQLVAAEAINAMVRELALQSQLVARDTDQWLLRVERESLNQAGTRDRLAAALQTAGHSVRLSIEIGRVTDSPSRRNQAAAAEKLLAAEQIIFDDPFVQSMMQDFGAKIVPGSIKPL
jgi:DNA polymerase-3 subunit gamma/tau